MKQGSRAPVYSGSNGSENSDDDEQNEFDHPLLFQSLPPGPPYPRVTHPLLPTDTATDVPASSSVGPPIIVGSSLENDDKANNTTTCDRCDRPTDPSMSCKSPLCYSPTPDTDCSRPNQTVPPVAHASAVEDHRRPHPFDNFCENFWPCGPPTRLQNEHPPFTVKARSVMLRTRGFDEMIRFTPPPAHPMTVRWVALLAKHPFDEQPHRHHPIHHVYPVDNVVQGGNRYLYEDETPDYYATVEVFDDYWYSIVKLMPLFVVPARSTQFHTQLLQEREIHVACPVCLQEGAVVLASESYPADPTWEPSQTLGLCPSHRTLWCQSKPALQRYEHMYLVRSFDHDNFYRKRFVDTVPLPE